MYTVASTALTPGTQTSEHAAMVSSGAGARIMAIIGTIIAVAPQVLDAANLLPDALRQSKIVQIILACIGGVILLAGAIQGTLTKIAYIQGRSQIKAAAVIDTAPSAPPPPPPVL